MSSHAQSRQATRCYASSRRKAARPLDLNGPPPEELPSGGIAAPVDLPVDTADDVLLLSSSSEFPQAMNQRRRKHNIVVIDEDLEIHAGRSGMCIENLVATAAISLSNHNKRKRIPENTMIIDCDVYPTFIDDHNAKKKKAMNAVPEPAKVVPKEPIFSCPVCMNELSEACSTNCGHVFCQGCIKLSIQKQKRCPTCRKSLNMRNFHRVYLPTTN